MMITLTNELCRVHNAKIPQNSAVCKLWTIAQTLTGTVNRQEYRACKMTGYLRAPRNDDDVTAAVSAADVGR